LVTRFRLEACFDIRISSIPVRTVPIHPTQNDPTLKEACRARPSHLTNVL
jgi:hypothetical protein